VAAPVRHTAGCTIGGGPGPGGADAARACPDVRVHYHITITGTLINTQA
jgi:hypothetical protein